MEREKNEFQTLEGLRTDQVNIPAKSSTEVNEQNSQLKRNWIKKIAVSTVFVVMISISLIVYALTGGQEADTIQAETDKQLQNKPQQVQNQRKKSSPKSNEALHLEDNKKVEVPKTQVKTSTTQRQNPSRLHQPPHPKNHEQPAREDQPMQIPEQLKDKIEKGETRPPL